MDKFFLKFRKIISVVKGSVSNATFGAKKPIPVVWS